MLKLYCLQEVHNSQGTHVSKFSISLLGLIILWVSEPGTSSPPGIPSAVSFSFTKHHALQSLLWSANSHSQFLGQDQAQN